MKTMFKSNPENLMRWLTGACGLAMLLILSQVGMAQQTTAASAAGTSVSKSTVAATSSPSPSTATARPAANPSEEEKDSSLPKKPGSEGVKVHGHWMLQVKNADGTPGERREFDNSLVTGSGGEGDELLVGMLSGNYTLADLSIGLVSGASGTYNGSWCQGPGGTPPAGISCYGLIANDGWASLWQQNYTVTQTSLSTVANFKTSRSIVLTANFVNQASYGLTSLSSVLTKGAGTASLSSIFNNDGQALNQSTDAPSVTIMGPTSGNNKNDFFFVFTETQIPNGPLAISAGQTVTVVVTISFS